MRDNTDGNGIYRLFCDSFPVRSQTWKNSNPGSLSDLSRPAAENEDSAHQRWRGPLALHKLFSDRTPGALPQAGIVAGRWPFRKYTHPTSKGQRPEPIPDRGKRKGQMHEPIPDRGKQQGPKARTQTGANRKGQRPDLYQTGATPRDKTSTLPKGLKARPISLFQIRLTQSGEILSRVTAGLAQIEGEIDPENWETGNRKLSVPNCQFRM